MSLIVHYKFEGNQNDSSGNGYNIVGSPSLSYVSNARQTGVNCNKTVGTAQVPRDNTTDVSGGTSNPTFTCNILCRLYDKAGQFVCNVNDGDGSYGDGWRWRLFHSGNLCLVTLSQGSNRGIGDLSGLVVGRLHVITLVVNVASNYARMYLDGSSTSPDADFSSYNISAPVNSNLTVLYDKDSTNQMRGSLYDYRLYDHAMSNAEVLTLSNDLLKEFRKYRILPQV